MAEYTPQDYLRQLDNAKTESLTGVSPSLLIRFSEILTTRDESVRANIAGNPEKWFPREQQTYTFRINPSRLKITMPKLEKWVLTKAGYERQSWGNDLVRFSYSGTSGVLVKPPGSTEPGARFDIRKTVAWAKFTEFRHFYRRTGDVNITMAMWGFPTHTWEGSLNGFDFDLDAVRAPRQILYNFTFTAIPFEYPITDILAATDVYG